MDGAPEKLCDDGSHMVIETAEEAQPTDGQVMILDLVGPHHPGILHEISQCLATRDVRMENVKTELEYAPMGGGSLRHAEGAGAYAYEVGQETIVGLL